MAIKLIEMSVLGCPLEDMGVLEDAIILNIRKKYVVDVFDIFVI